MKKILTLLTITIAALVVFAQDAPKDIPKKELPAKAICIVCASGGEEHGEEKPAAGVIYKGKAYYFCSGKEVAPFKKDPGAYLPPVLPRPFPDVKFTDSTGKVWDSKAFQSKVVLIDYWATWCGPCKEMLPALEKLYAKHKAAGFVLLSVSIDEKRADYDKFIAKHKFPNPVALDTTQTWSAFGVRLIPATFLIKDGQIIKQWTSKQKFETFDTAIMEALRK